MADNFSRLFIPPSHQVPEIPNVGNDFYRMLSGIGDSYIKAQERGREDDLRKAFAGGVPTRPDGSIDYDAMGKLVGGKADLDSVLRIAGLRETQRGKDQELEASRDFSRVFGGGAVPSSEPGPMPKPVTAPLGMRPEMLSGPTRAYRQDEYNPIDAAAPADRRHAGNC